MKLVQDQRQARHSLQRRRDGRYPRQRRVAGIVGFGSLVLIAAAMSGQQATKDPTHPIFCLKRIDCPTSMTR